MRAGWLSRHRSERAAGAVRARMLGLPNLKQPMPALHSLLTHTPEALDLVFIEGFRCETVIGIDDDEFDRSQPVRIDIVAGTPHAQAHRTDRIGDTIDYAAVRRSLIALLETHGFKLLESLAETVAQMVLTDHGAHWVRVIVRKPQKFPDVEAMGVMVERRRSELPPVP